MMGITRGIKLWVLSGFKLDLSPLECDDHFAGLGCPLINEAFNGMSHYRICFGKEYFMHAYGPLYALSADVVASLVALRNDRFMSGSFYDNMSNYRLKRYLLESQSSGTVCISQWCFRMFSNEDVTIGAWMLAMSVNHEDNRQLCQPECTASAIAVWDIPKCPGLCNPEKRLLELHQRESCTNTPTLDSDK